MLYDGHDWQIMQAFKPVVRVVGQHFKVNIIVDFDLSKNQDTQIFIGLSAPSPIENVNQTVLTWHKIDQRNVRKHALLIIVIDHTNQGPANGDLHKLR
jgi:hypothetical protein